MEEEICYFNPRICVIGLGYVGLPLARLFSTKYKTVGFELSQSRVDELMSGHDSTLEVEDELLQSALANGFSCTTDIEAIRDCNFYVVAVPTPVTRTTIPICVRYTVPVRPWARSSPKETSLSMSPQSIPV